MDVFSRSAPPPSFFSLSFHFLSDPFRTLGTQGKDERRQKFVAIKIEHKDYGSLRKEFKVYREVFRDPLVVGFPKLLAFGQENGVNVMVMEHLGPSLASMRRRCKGCFSLKTVLMLMIQMV